MIYFYMIILVVLAIIIWKKLIKRKAKLDRASVMIVIGSGGHTAEMLRLVSELPKQKYSPRIYVVAETDSTSEEKIHLLEKDIISDYSVKVSEYHIVRISRSREVGQSWISTVFTSFRASLESIPVIFKWKPAVLLCNGPGTCIPLCLAALIFKVLEYVNTEIIYIESICRVYDLSLSGKILYRLADHILVQWPELQKKYPKTVYLGRFY